MSNVFTCNIRTVHSTKAVNVRPWTATNTAEGLADGGITRSGRDTTRANE